MVEEASCQLPRAWIIVGLLLIFVVLIVGTIGNILVCTVLLRIKANEATFSSIFVISVALSDLLTCLTVLPFDVIYWIYFPVWILSPAVCKIWNSLFFTFIGCSALSLAEVAIDMYVAVSRPLHYHIYVTKFRAKVVVSITWVWCFAAGTVIYFYQEEPPAGEYLFDLTPAGYGSYLFAHMAAPCALVSVIYFKLFRIARGHASRLKIFPGRVTTESNSHDTELSGHKERKVSPPRKQEEQKIVKCGRKDRKLRIREELRLAKTFGLVATMFFVCWAPFFIVQLFYVFKFEDAVDGCALEIADTVVCWFAYIQCCINPILYAFRHRSFRKSMGKVFLRQGGISRVFMEKRETTIAHTNAAIERESGN